jgi:hypothetical protein
MDEEEYITPPITCQFNAYYTKDKIHGRESFLEADSRSSS